MKSTQLAIYRLELPQALMRGPAFALLLALLLFSSGCEKKGPVQQPFGAPNYGKTYSYYGNVYTVADTCDELRHGDIASFNNDIQPILNICRTCHSHDLGYGGVVLQSYEQVRPYAASKRLLGVVAHLPNYPAMPHYGYPRPPLDSCQVQYIAVWIAQGYPNN